MKHNNTLLKRVTALVTPLTLILGSVATADAARVRVKANCTPLVVTNMKPINSPLSGGNRYRLYINGDISVMSDRSYGPTVPNWKKSMIAIYYQVNNKPDRMIKVNQFTIDHSMRAWSKKPFRTSAPIVLPRSANHTIKVMAQVHNYECGKLPRAPGNLVYPTTTGTFNLNTIGHGGSAQTPDRIGRETRTYTRNRSRTDGRQLAGARNQ